VHATAHAEQLINGNQGKKLTRLLEQLGLLILCHPADGHAFADLDQIRVTNEAIERSRRNVVIFSSGQEAY